MFNGSVTLAVPVRKIIHEYHEASPENSSGGGERGHRRQAGPATHLSRHMQRRRPRLLRAKSLRLRQAGNPIPPPQTLLQIEGIRDRGCLPRSLPGIHHRRRRSPISSIRRRFAQILAVQLQLAAPARRRAAPHLPRLVR